MCAKWLEKGNCHKIIASIEAARNKPEAFLGVSRKSCAASFDAWQFNEAVAGLLSYIKFNEDFPECENIALLRNAILSLGERQIIAFMIATPR